MERNRYITAIILPCYQYLDYNANANIFLIKTEASGGSWVYEKIQAGLNENHFIFSLKAEMSCQVCLLYNPGYVQDDAGWCITIGESDDIL